MIEERGVDYRLFVENTLDRLKYESQYINIKKSHLKKLDDCSVVMMTTIFFVNQRCSDSNFSIIIKICLHHV